MSFDLFDFSDLFDFYMLAINVALIFFDFYMLAISLALIFLILLKTKSEIKVNQTNQSETIANIKKNQGQSK